MTDQNNKPSVPPKKDNGGKLGQVRQDANKAAKKAAEELDALEAQYKAAIDKVVKSKSQSILDAIQAMPQALMKELGASLENSDNPEFFRQSLNEINSEFLETFGIDTAK